MRFSPVSRRPARYFAGWLVASAWLAGFAFLHAAEPGVRVAKFHGDRAASLSFTFDDGWQDAASLGAPLLEKHGLRRTFFLVPGLLTEEGSQEPKNNYGKVPWKRWREVAAAGHEIGNHSYDHGMNFTDADDARLRMEIVGAHDLIRDKTGVAPVSFALPSSNTLNEWTVKVVDSCHLFKRRKITSYDIKKCTVESANALVERGIKNGEQMTTLFHAVAQGYDAFTSADVLDGHLAYVAAQRDRLWVDTFGRVNMYARERDAARLETKAAKGGVSFVLTTPSLDPRVFNAPLTVAIDVPGVSAAQATREGDEYTLPVAVKSDRILVDVVPGPKPVTVLWAAGK